MPSARDWAIWWVALTVGKPKYADVEPELLELMLDADDVRAQLLALVEADAKAFVPLSAAYGLPGNTDEEKAHKAQCSGSVPARCLRGSARHHARMRPRHRAVRALR